jgi:hypothetical protein
MGGSITHKIVSGTRYYYYHESYRVKVNPSDVGKTRGTGKSRVVTDEEYLGTAETIRRKVRKGGDRALKVYSRAFGLECAALSIASDLDLVGIIDKFVAKRKEGHSVGQYLVIAAINRISEPTSRRGIAGWIERTALPEKMRVDPRLLKSQN